jgi:hypothetical protein
MMGLDINIGLGIAGKYPVTVLDSATGQANGEFVIPWNKDELASLLARMNNFQTTDDDLREFGAQLFSAIFNGDIRTKYDAAYGAWLSGSDILRVRLRLQDPELQRLPWELMWDKTVGNFLLGSGRIQLSRHLPAPHPGSVASLGKPIRALVVCANPRYERPPLEELEAERSSIVRSLEKVGSVEMLRPPTLAELHKKLAEQQFDLIHFFGHGEFRADKGYLIFENEEGYTNPIDGPSLAAIIQGKDSEIQLVVLNTCESGRVSQIAKNETIGHSVSGVAQSLVTAGIPAVIAMQFRIPDISARIFTERFYTTLSEQLAKDNVDIEECVGKARVSVQAMAGRNFVDWAAPVVFLRSTLAGQAVAKSIYASFGRRRTHSDRGALDIVMGEDFIQVNQAQKTLILQSSSKYHVVVETTLEGLLHIYEVDPPKQSEEE